MAKFEKQKIRRLTTEIDKNTNNLSILSKVISVPKSFDTNKRYRNLSLISKFQIDTLLGEDIYFIQRVENFPFWAIPFVKTSYVFYSEDAWNYDPEDSDYNNNITIKTFFKEVSENSFDIITLITGALSFKATPSSFVPIPTFIDLNLIIRNRRILHAIQK